MSMPGILPIAKPDNFCNTSPEPIASGFFLLEDNPSLQQSIENTMTPNEPTLNIVEECTRPLYYDLDCEGTTAPDGYIFEIGLSFYTISVGNPDCSSIYTIHIKKPDGTWVKSNWEHQKSRSFYPETNGIYTIYIRQDNLGIDNWGGVTQIEEAGYLEAGGLCCRLIPIDECVNIDLVEQVDLTCTGETDNSLEYYYELTLNNEVFTSFVSVNTLSEEVDILDFNLTETNKISGNFISYNKVNPYFKASVEFLSSLSNEVEDYPLIEQAPICPPGNILGRPTIKDDNLVTQVIDFESFKLYPNPTSNEVMVIIDDYKERNQEMEVRLLDPFGRLIKNYNTVFQGGKFTLNIEELPSGAYFLNVRDHFASHTKKLIKK